MHIRFCSLSNNSKWQRGAPAQNDSHIPCMGYGTFIEMLSNFRRKKLKNDQSSKILGGSFSNKDNMKSAIQFRRESQPQHLKKRFFLKNRPIHFQIKSTSVTGPVKRNQLSFSCIKINKPLPTPIHSVS